MRGGERVPLAVFIELVCNLDASDPDRGRRDGGGRRNYEGGVSPLIDN